jgi:hypothetical protein
LLLALAMGLAAPAAMRGLEAARERGAAADVEALLASLPVLAFQAGGPLSLDAQALRQRLPDLPVGWALRVEPSLSYGPGGMALPAEVSLQAPGRQALRWHVIGLTGDVVRASP